MELSRGLFIILFLFLGVALIVAGLFADSNLMKMKRGMSIISGAFFLVFSVILR